MQERVSDRQRVRIKERASQIESKRERDRVRESHRARVTEKAKEREITVFSIDLMTL